MHDDQLAEFQSVLLEALYTKTEFTDIDKLLQNSEASTPFQSWLKQIQPPMLELGAGIVKKWGSKEEAITRSIK